MQVSKIIQLLLTVLFSKLSREKHSRYFDPSQKGFFNKFSLKKSPTLETIGGILGLGTECKFCRKCGKMFGAGEVISASPAGPLPGAVPACQPRDWAESESSEPHCPNRTARAQTWLCHFPGLRPCQATQLPAAVCSSATKSHFRFPVLFSYLDNFGFIVKYNALTVEGLLFFSYMYCNFFSGYLFILFFNLIFSSPFYPRPPHAIYRPLIFNEDSYLVPHFNPFSCYPFPALPCHR